MVPLVMCLLEGKQVGQYRQLLAHVKHQISEITGEAWTPQTVITDFEKALLLAIETELPQANQSGCYFHFCQALWRRVQKLGLATPYKTDEKLQKCIRKFMAIG